ncbi:MAG: hypothetical protein IPG25_18835 [Proteobacteria bacterium]|nr:hypothetical protein [Pseudomonadota bacterium]
MYKADRERMFGHWEWVVESPDLDDDNYLGVHQQRETYNATPARAPLLDLNLQCLELLVESARRSLAAAGGNSSVTQPLLAAWVAAPRVALERIAAAPFALVDSGIAEAQRWVDGSVGGVRDAVHERRAIGDAASFEAAAGTALLRRVLIYGWHLARSRPRAARLILGAEPAAVAMLASCSLATLDAVAEVRGPELHLHWHDQPDYWLRVLSAASAVGNAPRLADLLLVGVRRLVGQGVGMRPRGLR